VLEVSEVTLSDLKLELLQNIVVVHILVVDIQEAEFATVEVKHVYQLVLLVVLGRKIVPNHPLAKLLLKSFANFEADLVFLVLYFERFEKVAGPKLLQFLQQRIRTVLFSLKYFTKLLLNPLDCFGLGEPVLLGQASHYKRIQNQHHVFVFGGFDVLVEVNLRLERSFDLRIQN